MATMSVLPDWITVREAACELLNVTPQRVHQLIEIYGLETRKLNPRLTMLRRDQVAKLAQENRPAGQHIENRSTKRSRARRGR